MRKIYATVEYGVCGYVADTVNLVANSVKDLIKQINEKTNKMVDEVNAADERDGDLRQFTSENANGYPSLVGLGVTFGEDELCGSLIIVKIGERDIDYREKMHVAIRRETNLN